MRYKLLGKSGLRVSELALGTMTFGEDWGWGSSKEESRRVFETYTGAGGNFIDTANLYTNGTSERFTGEFVAADREHFVLATKYTLSMRDGDPNFSGNHRKNMVQSLEASLKRLNTEYIDLYWVHAWDSITPIEEVMRGLDDLVRAGKILYIGISDAPAWVVAQANTMAELRGWTQFVGVQVQYNLIERSIEREILPMARALDVGVTVWGPLESGVLTGKYNKESPDKGRAALKRPVPEEKLKIAATLVEIAEEIGCTPSQAALAWIRRQPGVVIPILGARTVAQLEDNLGCLDVTLSAEQRQRLDERNPLDLGFPSKFLTRKPMRQRIFGGTFEQIDNYRSE